MTTIQAVPDSPTELRLDYDDIAAGRLVIVIDGLPTSDRDGPVLATERPRTAPAARSGRDRGRGASCSALGDEAAAAGRAIGDAPALATPLLLAAWRGKEALTTELAEATIEEDLLVDRGSVNGLTEYAKAVLYNGLGRYQDALVSARRACEREDHRLFGRAFLELVEASARSGETVSLAAHELRVLEDGAWNGSDWSLGIWARSAALLSDGAAAEPLYREAIDRFQRHGAGLQLARARLVYGEWLRRENRRVDAREQLRTALETFAGSGTAAFAERARRELLATGETARRRLDETRGALTPQEAQIARLARDGFSNPEIGHQLFISHRTVQYHLRKVFSKLEITSRNQLGRFPVSRLQST